MAGPDEASAPVPRALAASDTATVPPAYLHRAGDGPQTTAVHASRPHNATHAVAPPIWQTSTFSADSAEAFAELATAKRPAEFYTRYGNPTHAQVEATVAALEGGEAAMVFGSGMGAIFGAVASLLASGDHAVVQRNHYAGTTALFRDVLPRWGIEATAVDQTRPEAFEEALRPNTRLLFVETPTNPLMQLTDLEAVVRLARARGILTMVDNTFATPLNQRPLDLGVDAVVHSATKYLGGHHDVTAGVLVGTRALVERAWSFAIVAGATLSPFEGWLLLRGLRTIGLRVERHNRNGLALARFLEASPRVARVHYPGLASHPQHALAARQMRGFTGMMGVELRGGFAEADRFLAALRLGTRAVSLGGFETLVVHPAAMWSHQLTPEQQRETGLGAGLLRISAGLEDEADLLRDFAQALDAVAQ